MNKKSTFSRLYVRYIIRRSTVFYLFLLTGIVVFLYLTISLDVDITQYVTISIEDNVITLSGDYELQSDVIYLYQDRNDQVYRVAIEQIRIEEGQVQLITSNVAHLSGDMSAEIVIGSQTLFERILMPMEER